MKKHAVITGAGSGVGAATAARFVKEGWHVALLGRREETLRLTAKATSNPDACLTYPCDIATPLLEKRPAPPSSEARTKMLTPEGIAECVMLAVNLPSRAVIEELLIRPR